VTPLLIRKAFVHIVLTMGIITLACQVCTSEQVERKTATQRRSMVTNATCYDESTGKLTGSHKSRTAVLSAPDGRYRAYAESGAVSSPNTVGGECQNTSKLFVAGPNSPDFQEVMVIKPIQERHGNSIELVDWSPTGHRLLLGEGAWEWGSDSFGSMTRIYDAESKTLSQDSVLDRAFLKALGRDCVAILRPAGFSASGGVVIRTGPYFDVGEDSPDKDSCVTKEELWLIDAEKSTARSLPDEYKVKHYGKESVGIGAEVRRSRSK
jgi:dipeptidyl aminopeptidase/acylaminoacyl peptidase